MRIQMDEARARRYDRLRDATGEGHKSRALDRAANYYLRMRGSPATGPGVIAELLAAADERGSLTAAEIVELVDTTELPVGREIEVEIGPEGSSA